MTSRHEPRRAPYETIHHRVRWWSEKQPTAVALSTGDVRLTYAELDVRAELLAAELRDRGVTRETAVGVSLPRSPEFVIGALAILKAGGYYVPVDPAYPVERRRLIAGDARLRWMVTGPDTADRWAGEELTRVVLADGLPVTSAQPVQRACHGVPPGAAQLAYAVYTSGSTGRPKGVTVTHANVLSLADTDPRLRITAGEVVAQLAPTSFDASVFEVWAALCNGAQVSFLAADDVSIAGVERDLARTRPDWLFLTTGLFHAVMEQRPEALAPVGRLITGGDVLSPKHVNAAAASPTTVLAAYGPTEATVFSSLHVVEPDQDPDRVPLGTALSGRTMVILDDALRPVPDGEPGEICVGGAGVARGYLGRPGATAAAFVPDPSRPGARLYRTGDRGRRRADGVVEFLGRHDRQVKIRGFRVEPGEVESFLDTCDGVRSAVVLAVAAPDGEKRLVAYVVTAPDSGTGAADLRAAAEDRLPAYTRPSYYLLVDELPLDPNGKVDRSRLPQPWRHRDQLGLGRYEPARTPVEAALGELLAESLGLDQVGRDDDFFALGGTSLQSVQVLERLRVQGHALTSREFFGHPTVADLAGFLSERSAARS